MADEESLKAGYDKYLAGHAGRAATPMQGVVAPGTETNLQTEAVATEEEPNAASEPTEAPEPTLNPENKIEVENPVASGDGAKIEKTGDNKVTLEVAQEIKMPLDEHPEFLKHLQDLEELAQGAALTFDQWKNALSDFEKNQTQQSSEQSSAVEDGDASLSPEQLAEKKARTRAQEHLHNGEKGDLDDEAKQYLDDERNKLQEQRRQAKENEHRARAKRHLLSGEKDDLDDESKKYLDDERNKLQDERRQAAEADNRAQAKDHLLNGEQGELGDEAKQYLDDERNKLQDERAKAKEAEEEMNRRLNPSNNDTSAAANDDLEEGDTKLHWNPRFQKPKKDAEPPKLGEDAKNEEDPNENDGWQLNPRLQRFRPAKKDAEPPELGEDAKKDAANEMAAGKAADNAPGTEDLMKGDLTGAQNPSIEPPKASGAAQSGQNAPQGGAPQTVPGNQKNSAAHDLLSQRSKIAKIKGDFQQAINKKISGITDSLTHGGAIAILRRAIPGLDALLTKIENASLEFKIQLLEKLRSVLSKVKVAGGVLAGLRLWGLLLAATWEFIITILILLILLPVFVIAYAVYGKNLGSKVAASIDTVIKKIDPILKELKDELTKRRSAKLALARTQEMDSAVMLKSVMQNARAANDNAQTSQNYPPDEMAARRTSTTPPKLPTQNPGVRKAA